LSSSKKGQGQKKEHRLFFISHYYLLITFLSTRNCADENPSPLGRRKISPPLGLPPPAVFQTLWGLGIKKQAKKKTKRAGGGGGRIIKTQKK
jgi:hypothetical protein